MQLFFYLFLFSITFYEIRAIYDKELIEKYDVISLKAGYFKKDISKIHLKSR